MVSKFALFGNIAKIAGTLTAGASTASVAGGAATAAGTASTAGAARAASTAGAASLGAKIIGGLKTFGAVSAMSTLIVEGFKASVVGIKDTIEHSTKYNKIQRSNKEAINEYGGKANGIYAEDILNQAAATIKKVRKIYGKEISEETYSSLVAAYKQTLKNTNAFTDEQISAYTEYFEYALKEANKHSNVTLDLAYDPTKANKQISSYLSDIEKTEEYGRSLIEKTNKETDAAVNNITESVNTLGDTSVSIPKNVESTFGKVKNSISAFSGEIVTKVKNIKANIDSLRNLSSTISLNFSTKFNKGVDTSNIKWTTGTKTLGLNGFAGGGTPKSGSLFYANENGKSELVGNFGGYTGVANQGMILQAMEAAVSSGMVKAMKNNNNSNITVEVCKGGMFVGDNSSIRKLAAIINNTNNNSNYNIANTKFSMN